jgi:hypothetical protein
MTELSGSLEGIGLSPLIGFLTGLGKSGRLAVEEGPMAGEVHLETGQVIGAAFDVERGLPALDAIGLALGNGRFTFREANSAELERNLTLNAGELRQHLDELAHEQVAIATAIPSLMAVPRVAVDDADSDEEIGLDRDTLRLLLVLDGRRSVAELARERGLLRTLKQLSRLAQLGLARVDVPAEPLGGPVPTSPVEWRPGDGSQTERGEPEPPTPGPAGNTWSRWHRPGS